MIVSVILRQKRGDPMRRCYGAAVSMRSCSSLRDSVICGSYDCAVGAADTLWLQAATIQRVVRTAEQVWGAAGATLYAWRG